MANNLQKYRFNEGSPTTDPGTSSELNSALAEDFENNQTELQAVKTELASNTATMHSEVEAMKATMMCMEHTLSSHSDDVSLLQTKVGKFTSEVKNL